MSEKPGTIVTYAEDLKWQPVGPRDAEGKGYFVSLMYGDLEKKGPTHFLMKYSAGKKAPPHTHSGDYYAVVVSGKFRHFLESDNEYELLTAGSTWFQRGGVVHQDECVGPEDGILSIFWPRGFDVEFVEALIPETPARAGTQARSPAASSNPRRAGRGRGGRSKRMPRSLRARG